MDACTISPMTELEIAQTAMSIGWVKFSYTKADGSLRFAVGTTNRQLIDAVRGYKMTEYRENSHFYENCGYFDLSRCDWRRYSPSRFGHLEFDNMSTEDAITNAMAISLDADEPIAEIEKISVSLIGYEETKRVLTRVCDSNVRWCMRHNGGRGLNGVSLAAGGVISSGYDCFGSPIGIGHHKTESTEPTTHTPSRSELIAELNRLRQRETEILRTLLSA